MGNIQDLLAQILSARYGRDVRQSIHDAIETCYEDGHAGAIDLQAREDIAQEVTDREDADVLINGRVDAVEDELSASATGSITDTIWTSTYYNFLTKNGNVVSLVTGGATASPISVTSESVLFKVPEGFRPKATIRFLCTYQASSSGETQIKTAALSPNGEVKMQISAGSTQEVLVFRLYGAWGV